MIKNSFTLSILLTALSAFGPLACHADLPALTVLHSFGSHSSGKLTPAQGDAQEGANPEAPLLLGPNGALYGTTSSGGTHETGTVFKINSDGTGFTVMHSFGPRSSYSSNAANSDGLSPEGALIQDSGGTLYGAMGGGGTAGGGTIFKLKSDGSGFAVIHVFQKFGTFGANEGGCAPLGVTLGSDGLLYGTTALGDQNGEGMVYCIKTDGTGFQILHTFSSAIFGDNSNSDGAHPTTALSTGSGSVFYGTTLRGGKHGCGVIYKISANGKGFAVLHDFTRKPHIHKNSAADPPEALTIGPQGNIYGNTQREGNTDGGAVFKMSADGTAFSLLHTFSATNADSSDGSLPTGPLVFGARGLLYGLTGEGGAHGAGTLFAVSPEDSKFFVLHDFAAPDSTSQNTDGGFTLAGLTLGHEQAIFGVSTYGGANGTGTIFRVTLTASK